MNVEEAWVELGRKRGWLEPFEGSSLYLLVGKAPRFERQPFRRLESYGLVSQGIGLPITSDSREHYGAASRPIKHDEALATLRLAY